MEDNCEKIILNSNGEKIYINEEKKYVVFNEKMMNFNLKYVKNYLFPIHPIVNDANVYFFDYDRGIEIVNNNENTYLKVKAIQETHFSNNFAFFITSKKIIKFDCITKTIVSEKKHSDNLYFCDAKGICLFSRVERNKTYLYVDIQDKELLLKNFPILNHPIIKVALYENILICFHFDGVIEYDILKDSVIYNIEIKSIHGAYFLINELINIEFKNENPLIENKIYMRYGTAGLLFYPNFIENINLQDLIDELKNILSQKKEDNVILKSNILVKENVEKIENILKKIRNCIENYN